MVDNGALSGWTAFEIFREDELEFELMVVTLSQFGVQIPVVGCDVVRCNKSGEIFWILTNGVVRRGMPAWSKLPAEQRWQIITWLKSAP